MRQTLTKTVFKIFWTIFLCCSEAMHSFGGEQAKYSTPDQKQHNVKLFRRDMANEISNKLNEKNLEYDAIAILVLIKEWLQSISTNQHNNYPIEKLMNLSRLQQENDFSKYLTYISIAILEGHGFANGVQQSTLDNGEMLMYSEAISKIREHGSPEDSFKIELSSMNAAGNKKIFQEHASSVNAIFAEGMKENQDYQQANKHYTQPEQSNTSDVNLNNLNANENYIMYNNLNNYIEQSPEPIHTAIKPIKIKFFNELDLKKWLWINGAMIVETQAESYFYMFEFPNLDLKQSNKKDSLFIDCENLILKNNVIITEKHIQKARKSFNKTMAKYEIEKYKKKQYKFLWQDNVFKSSNIKNQNDLCTNPLPLPMFYFHDASVDNDFNNHRTAMLFLDGVKNFCQEITPYTKKLFQIITMRKITGEKEFLLTNFSLQIFRKILSALAYFFDQIKNKNIDISTNDQSYKKHHIALLETKLIPLNTITLECLKTIYSEDFQSMHLENNEKDESQLQKIHSQINFNNFDIIKCNILEAIKLSLNFLIMPLVKKYRQCLVIQIQEDKKIKIFLLHSLLICPRSQKLIDITHSLIMYLDRHLADYEIRKLKIIKTNMELTLENCGHSILLILQKECNNKIIKKKDISSMQIK
jgi:hypothetical protein